MIPHPWDLSPSEAIALQKQLATQIDTNTPLQFDKIQTVAGVDCSVKNNKSRGAIVVLDYPSLNVIEAVSAEMPTPFPYIPGLLTFREGEVILKAHAKLKHQPDAYIFDGHGIIHPRRLGIAAHMGLWLQKPSIGCGKTHFIGTYGDLGQEKGDSTPIYHHEEVIGALLRTRRKVKPVYVSAGHMSTLESAIELILSTTTRYKLPEPIRAAHRHAGEF